MRDVRRQKTDMNIEALEEFRIFVNREIVPATKDLEKLSDGNRKHVQKLVYTNLVDRFDSAVDSSLLKNCREEPLVTDAAKRLSQPITEADLLQLLLQGDTLQDALEAKLRASLRESVLRQRHSRKVSKLFEVLQPDQECWNTPRVNISAGTIHSKVTPKKGSVPYSICGYADWLYSRRNAIVHGSGSPNVLANDADQLERLFKCKPAKRIRVQLSSTTTAAKFYSSVVELLIGP
jgi:hypothetical protein